MTDYIREEADTDNQADAQCCGKCGMVRSDNHLCQMGSGGTSPLPPITQVDISTELRRAEAAAIETCKAVAQSLESVEDAKRVQPEELGAAA